MPRLATALLLSASLCAAPAAAQTTYQLRVTNLNRVGLSITNYGFYGNNFVSRTPSCEYPLGLGIEHMSRAGLWLGGLVITQQGEAYRVTTGAIDNAQGSNQAGDTEWTPLAGGIVQRSNLPNSRFFDPAAVSEQDFVCSFSDLPGRGPSGQNTEDHVPLSVDVRQSIYSFSIEPASHFTILHLEIVNMGNLLRDLHAGLYTQLVSGDKDLYGTWPPSAGSGPGSWYYRHYVDYVDSLKLVREHICDLFPPGGEPAECLGFDRAPYWAGVKLLGVKPGELVGRTVGCRIWNWDPQDTTRDRDADRYTLLSAGIVDPPHQPDGSQYSPIELLTVGPISFLPPGDTLTVDLAFVFGDTEASLAEHADFAQFAYELDYRLPRPPPSPRFHTRPGRNSVTFLWDDSPERATDDTSPQPGGIDFEGYRLYFGPDRNDPPRIAEFDLVDTTRFNTGLDGIRLPEPEIVDGDTLVYSYTLAGLRDGFSYFAAVTSFDTGDDQVPSLESGITQNKRQIVSSQTPEERGGVVVFPNPYKVEATWDAGTLARDHYLWFANLPRQCRLSIYTLAGDLVYETDFDGDTYSGENTRGVYDPDVDLDVPPPDLSGGAFAWNLISREGQAVATGLYLFSVRDNATGDVQRGKFLVLKSDREGY
jgi:hypothetical protein